HQSAAPAAPSPLSLHDALPIFKFDEVANVFITGPKLGSVSFFLTMSQAKYDSLTDAQKKAIDDNSGVELSAKGEAGWNALAVKKIGRAHAELQSRENLVCRLLL